MGVQKETGPPWRNSSSIKIIVKTTQEGDDVMKSRYQKIFLYLKILIVGLVLSFGTQACALWIGDGDHGHGYHDGDYDHHYHYHYRDEDGHGGYWNRHSSVEQSGQSVAQLAKSEDSGRQ
jgi:hypothetical protein